MCRTHPASRPARCGQVSGSDVDVESINRGMFRMGSLGSKKLPEVEALDAPSSTDATDSASPGGAIRARSLLSHCLHEHEIALHGREMLVA